VITLRHDDEALLAIDVAGAHDRRDGANTGEIAIDHPARHATLDQDVVHHRWFVVTVARAVTAHDQVLDLAGPPQLDGGIETLDQPGIQPARRVEGQGAQHQRHVDLRQSVDIGAAIRLAPACHDLARHCRQHRQGDHRHDKRKGRCQRHVDRAPADSTAHRQSLCQI